MLNKSGILDSISYASAKLRPVHWIILMILLGFILRLTKLEASGLWMDEIHSAVGSDPNKTFAEVIEYSKRDQPPLFFLMLHGWYRLISYSDFAGLFLVVITGIAGIIAVYFAGFEWKNSGTGLFAAFLTTINYFHINLSRQLRFYPLVFLLSTLSFLFFLQILKRKNCSSFVGYFIATSLLLNTHYFGIVVFASQMLIFMTIILWKQITDRRFLLSCLGTFIFVVLSFVHWIPVVVSDLKIPEFHAQKISWYFPALFHWVYFQDVVTAIVTAGLFFLSIRQLYFLFTWKQLNESHVILLGWLGYGFLIPLSYSIIRMPMLEYKYSIIVLPAIFLFIALGWDTINSKFIKTGLIVILFASFHLNALFIRPIHLAKPQEQWKNVTEAVLKTDSESQIVFSNYAWYYRYYFKQYGSIHQPLEPSYADFEAWLHRSDKVWILVSKRFADPGLSQAQTASLNSQFKLQNELQFDDTIAKFYTRQGL